jgi:uncharacterized membrane protein
MLSIVLNALWDLFRGIVPVLIAWPLARGIRRSRGAAAWFWLPVGIAWLAFLPNAPYLLTEIRHYLDRNPALVWDEEGARRFLLISGFYLLFSGSGLVLFALAIRPVERALKERGVRTVLLAPLLFFACAFGVYLGLRMRFNSWDLWTQLGDVWDGILRALANPRTLAMIAGFSGFLWLAYLAVDIWLDGLEQRLRPGPTRGEQ